MDGMATSEEEKRWNGAMKHVRISIEWNYMTSAALFPYIKEINKLKILESNIISRVYIVVTLIRSMYSCIYGNETSHYFGYIFSNDFLEKYMTQT
jgi:hypothetical protein